jgi:carbonic anhydrase
LPPEGSWITIEAYKSTKAHARAHPYRRAPPPARSTTTTTTSLPTEQMSHPALASLLRANAQWAGDVEKAEPGFFAQSAKGQTPSVLWIGCADSRAPESVVMAARPGEVFVHRNIAKCASPRPCVQRRG